MEANTYAIKYFPLYMLVSPTLKMKVGGSQDLYYEMGRPNYFHHHVYDLKKSPIMLLKVIKKNEIYIIGQFY